MLDDPDASQPIWIMTIEKGEMGVLQTQSFLP